VSELAAKLFACIGLRDEIDPTVEATVLQDAKSA
jgi:hypothetical protein